MKAACKHGHRYTPANTMWRTLATGRRAYQCRECHRRRTREYRAFLRRMLGVTYKVQRARAA